MIGREAELQALQAAFERVMAAGAGLQRVLVVADAGVGKSRLLYEFDNWADARPDRFFIFQARATPQSAEPTLFGCCAICSPGACRSWTTTACGRASASSKHGMVPLFAGDGPTRGRGPCAPAGPADRPRLRPQPAHHATSATTRGRSATAASTPPRKRCGASARSGGSPLVIQLDDLHWADDALARLHRPFAPGRRATCRCCCSRSPARHCSSVEPTAAEHVHARIELAPLDRHASRGLADELLKKLPRRPGRPARARHRRRRRQPVLHGRAGEDADRPGRHPHRRALERRRRQAAVAAGAADAHRRAAGAARRPAAAGAPCFAVGERDRLEVLGCGAGPRRAAGGRAATVAAPAGADRPRRCAGQRWASTSSATRSCTRSPTTPLLKRDKREAHARTAQWLAQHDGRSRPGPAGDRRPSTTRRPATPRTPPSSTPALPLITRPRSRTSRRSTARRAALVWRRPTTASCAGGCWPRASARWSCSRDARRSSQDIDALLALAEALPPGAEGDARRAEAAWRRCDIADRTANGRAAEREARRALELAERAGAEDVALRAMQRLAQALAFQGDPAAGLAIAEAGLARAKALGIAGGAEPDCQRHVAVCRRARRPGGEPSPRSDDARVLPPGRRPAQRSGGA